MLAAPSNGAHIIAHWAEFLSAAGSFYAILEQASKISDHGKSWFGRKKHERKSDPLLSYVHHARNTEEHGVAPIAKLASSGIELVSQGAAVKLESDGIGTWNVVEMSGDVRFKNDVVKLLTVTDVRFGDSFHPPVKHMGAPLIEPVTPALLSQLALAHIERLFVEAEIELA